MKLSFRLRRAARPLREAAKTSSPNRFALADSNATKDPGWLVAGCSVCKKLLTPSGGL
jgi:hypothetical protein